MVESIEVLRADDLLHLHIDGDNLRLDHREGEPPGLVLDDAAQAGFLIVRFPAQTRPRRKTIAEAARPSKVAYWELGTTYCEPSNPISTIACRGCRGKARSPSSAAEPKHRSEHRLDSPLLTGCERCIGPRSDRCGLPNLEYGQVVRDRPLRHHALDWLRLLRNSELLASTSACGQR